MLRVAQKKTSSCNVKIEVISDEIQWDRSASFCIIYNCTSNKNDNLQKLCSLKHFDTFISYLSTKKNRYYTGRKKIFRSTILYNLRKNKYIQLKFYTYSTLNDCQKNNAPTHILSRAIKSMTARLYKMKKKKTWHCIFF